MRELDIRVLGSDDVICHNEHDVQDVKVVTKMFFLLQEPECLGHSQNDVSLT